MILFLVINWLIFRITAGETISGGLFWDGFRHFCQKTMAFLAFTLEIAYNSIEENFPKGENL